MKFTLLIFNCIYIQKCTYNHSFYLLFIISYQIIINNKTNLLNGSFDARRKSGQKLVQLLQIRTTVVQEQRSHYIQIVQTDGFLLMALLFNEQKSLAHFQLIVGYFLQLQEPSYAKQEQQFVDIELGLVHFHETRVKYHDQNGYDVLDGVDVDGILVHHAQELDNKGHCQNQMLPGDRSLDVQLQVYEQ